MPRWLVCTNLARREFLNSTDDMVKVYTSATEGQAHPGPLLSHGNWILLALLVGNAGGGHGVRHLLQSIEVALISNCLSPACMVAGFQWPCR